MTVTPRMPWPLRTTARGGALLLLSGLLLLLVAARVEVPVTAAFVVPLDGPVLTFLAAATRAAAFVILATGTAGELGITAHSPVGRGALAMWGARDLVFLLLGLAPFTIGSALGGLAISLQLLFAASALIAAIQVIRVRVLSGAARWALLPVAGADCVLVALTNPLPFATDAALSVTLALSAWPSEFLYPALTLLVALALLLWGRIGAIKHHAQVIHESW